LLRSKQTIQCAALNNMSFNVQPWSKYWHTFWLSKPFGLDKAFIST